MLLCAANYHVYLRVVFRLLWNLHHALILFRIAISVLWLRVFHHDPFFIVLGVNVE